MTTKENNFAFIDSQNLHLGVKSLGWKIDWKKFRIYLKEKYHVGKAYLFFGHIPENKDLYDFLKNAGYELIFKPVVKNKLQEIKGNVDAELVLQSAAIDFLNYDQAIIITGDGDFYCLVKYLLQNRKLRRLIVPNRFRYSILLKRVAVSNRNISFFNDLQNILEYKSSANKGGATGGST